MIDEQDLQFDDFHVTYPERSFVQVLSMYAQYKQALQMQGLSTVKIDAEIDRLVSNHEFENKKKIINTILSEI